MSALYYPGLDVVTVTTKTGMIITNHPALYTKPVTERTIVHVDVLQTIPQIIGKVINSEMAKEEFIRTQGLFKLLLMGNVSNESYRRATEELWLNSNSFRHYFMYVTEFGEKSQPTIMQMLKPLRDGLDYYTGEYMCLLNSFPKSKFCMRTHEQLYYSIAWKARIPDFPIEIEYIEA